MVNILIITISRFQSFFEMVNDYEKKLDYAKNNTSLPDSPDYKAINDFVASVNERVVKGEI